MLGAAELVVVEYPQQQLPLKVVFTSQESITMVLRFVHLIFSIAIRVLNSLFNAIKKTVLTLTLQIDC